MIFGLLEPSIAVRPGLPSLSVTNVEDAREGTVGRATFPVELGIGTDGG